MKTIKKLAKFYAGILAIQCGICTVAWVGHCWESIMGHGWDERLCDKKDAAMAVTSVLIDDLKFFKKYL